MAEKQMDAIALLEADHRKVDGYFKDFQELGDRAYKSMHDLYLKIRQELEIHTKVEEDVFYPAAREVAPDLIKEGKEEHDKVDQILMKLGRLGSEDQSWHSTMTELMENVQHHVGEEEHELFPKLRKTWDQDRLHELGEQMHTRKQELMKQHSERAA